MNATRAPRPIPLALTALVALFSALVALAVSNGHDAHAHPTTPHEADNATATITRAELTLRRDLRQLWEDHIVWTRLAVISLTTGTPDAEATVSRLLGNQTDIGNALKPFYGKSAGNKVTSELRRHILIAADLIAAAKAGDEARLAEHSARWQRNADDIAAVLHSVNPRHFELAVLKAEMRTPCRTTSPPVSSRSSRGASGRA